MVRQETLDSYQNRSPISRRTALCDRLRITNSFRSNADSSRSADRWINTCCINGSLALAVCPKVELSVGTSRQPKTFCPSSATTDSNIFLPLALTTGSGEA